jgi:hypothetical protein
MGTPPARPPAAEDAKPRDSRGLRPTAELLSGGGQLLLSTSLGPLDVLCALHDQRGYDELLPKTEVLTEGPRQIRLLDLPTLMLPILIALRDRKLQE